MSPVTRIRGLVGATEVVWRKRATGLFPSYWLVMQLSQLNLPASSLSTYEEGNPYDADLGVGVLHM